MQLENSVIGRRDLRRNQSEFWVQVASDEEFDISISCASGEDESMADAGSHPCTHQGHKIMRLGCELI